MIQDAAPPAPAATAARPGARFWLAALVDVLVRPWLWFAALRQALRLARPRWWRRPPFLPLPDRAYLEFRFRTAYGAGRAPRARDLVAYLTWCRERER